MTLGTKILVFLGLRTKCCGAKIVFLQGWDWRRDRNVCAKCWNEI